jgi:hypothetical protein
VTTGSLPNLQNIVMALQAHAPTMADELATFFQGNIAMKNETGTFRESMKGESDASESQVSLRVVSNDPLAVVKLEPTSPHEIYPLHPAEALYWPGADHPVAHVHHPGTVGLGVQVEAMMEQAMMIVSDEWELIVQEGATP